jgi:hypothetical protein
LYKIIANFEISVVNGYYPFTTALITLGLFFLTLLIPLVILRFTVLKNFFPPPTTSPGFTPLINHLVTTQKLNEWTTKNYYFLIGIMCLIILPLVGSYFIIRGLLAGPLTTITINDLYAGKTPASKYVQIEGQTVIGKAVATEYNDITTVYFPIFPSRSLDKNYDQGPVKLVVSKLSYNQNPDEWKGLLSHLLPAFSKNLLIEKGYTISEQVWYLEGSEDPSSYIGLGIAFAGGGAFLGAVILLINRWYKNKKTKKIKT